MDMKKRLEQRMNEYSTSVDPLIDEHFLDFIWQNRYVYIYLYGKFINKEELEYIKQVITNLKFKPQEKCLSNHTIIHEILDLKRTKKQTAEQTIKDIRKLNKKIGDNL